MTESCRSSKLFNSILIHRINERGIFSKRVVDFSVIVYLICERDTRAEFTFYTSNESSLNFNHIVVTILRWDFPNIYGHSRKNSPKYLAQEKQQSRALSVGLAREPHLSSYLIVTNMHTKQQYILVL